MKDDRVYLQHIRDALEDVAAYCGSDHDAFVNDRMRQDANAAETGSHRTGCQEPV